MAPPIPRLDDVYGPPGLRQYRALDRTAEAAWCPDEGAPSFEEFVAAGGRREEGDDDVEEAATSVFVPPKPPPDPVFHHIRPGPESGMPWLHPDLTNAVCSSMSIGDVKVLANRQALEAQRANQEVVLASGQTYTLSKYQWDDGGLKDTTRDIVSVYIPLREYDCSELCRERVECTFEEQSLSLTVHLPRSNRAVLAVRKLARPIVPEQCKVRVDVAAKRVILKLKKKDNSKDVARWGGLADGYHAMPNKNPLRGSLIRPENYHEELIDIRHYRNWDGPPKYDMYSDD